MMDYETFASRLNQVILELSIEHAGMLSMGVASYYKAGNDDIKKSNLTKTQQATISKISAEHFGYMAEFDKALGETLKENVKKIFEREGGFGDVKQEILQHIDDVFSGKEKITINHVGQRRTVLNVDKHGNLYQTEKVIQQPYTTTPEAYADMLSRTASHRALERGRADALGKMGFDKFRYISACDERSRPAHCALSGKVFEYGTDQAEMALSILGEPNCRCSTVAFFSDPDLDSPESKFEKYKERAGVYWDEEMGDWAFKDRDIAKRGMLEKGLSVGISTPLNIKYSKQLKDLTDDELASEYASLKSGTLNKKINQWYYDSDMASLDASVTDVFGLSPSSSRANELLKLTDEEREQIKRSYQVTQEYLTRKYPDGTITIYRGVGGDAYKQLAVNGLDSTVDVSMYNLSCWTDDIKVARGFTKDNVGGVVIKTDVPIDKVFMHYEISDPVHEFEREITIMGDSITVTVDDIRVGKSAYTEREILERKTEIERLRTQPKKQEKEDDGLDFDELFG